MRNDSVAQINPTNLAYGFYSVDASGRIFVTGNLGVTGSVGVSGGTITAFISAGSGLTATVSGNVSAAQLTNPWVVQLISGLQAFTNTSATAAGDQGFAPMAFIDAAGTSGINSTASRKWGQYAVNASGHQWVMITGTGGQVTAIISGTATVSGQVTAILSGTATINGTAGVTQSTSPWVVSGSAGTWNISAFVSGTATAFISGGNVSASQVTNPWIVQLISGTQAFTSGSATAAAQQGFIPWALVDSAGTSGVNPSIDGKYGWSTVNASGHTYVKVTGTALVSATNTVTVSASNTVTVSASNTVTVSANNTLTVQGVSASGSTIAGNPVQFGGVGKTANPGAASDGQAVMALFDKVGKQAVVGSIRDLKAITHTQVTGSTEVTAVSAIASTFNDIYAVIIANTSSANTAATFRDSSGGTTRFVIDCPANDTRGFMLPESGAWPQATVNTNWTVQFATAVPTAYVSVLYVKNI